MSEKKLAVGITPMRYARYRDAFFPLLEKERYSPHRSRNPRIEALSPPHITVARGQIAVNAMENLESGLPIDGAYIRLCSK